MNFRVEKYSLCKDVAKSQKNPKGGGGGQLEHVTPPLVSRIPFFCPYRASADTCFQLVMNNFTTADASETSRIPKHLETLLTSTFQSLFPPISPQSTPLSSIRRVLLLNRETSHAEDGSYVVNLRHYAVTTKILHQNLSRGVKRLQRIEKHALSKPKISQPVRTVNEGPQPPIKRPKGALPNLNRMDDVADYLLDPASGGYTSASESEIDTDAEVDVLETSARKVMNRRDQARLNALRAAEAAETTGPDSQIHGEIGQAQSTKKARTAPPVQKRAVKMTEIGPRMKLRLVKVEEGMCDGKVLWHEFITKTKEEERRQEEVWNRRKKEKEERRRVQKENLAAKKKSSAGKPGEGAEGGEEEMDYDDLDDDEWDGDGDEAEAEDMDEE